MNVFCRDGKGIIIINIASILFSDYAFAKIFKNGKNKVVYSNLLLRTVSKTDHNRYFVSVGFFEIFMKRIQQ